MAEAQRHIAHFDLDAFFVSVERLQNPALTGKPLLVGGTSDRGVVAACSYEARKYGIQSAMPMKQAMKLCPQAIVVKGNRHLYSHYSKIVTAIIAEKVPAMEKASIDEFYVDLTGMDKFFHVQQYTRELRETIIKETGLPISYGLSTSKLVSKIATNEAKPNGYLEIPAGKETAFLWPLAVNKIPMVGKQTEQQLKKLGIYTIEQLAKTPVEQLEHCLGNWGIALWNKAHGVDPSPVEQRSEQKSISHENTFGEDTNDLTFLHNQLVRLTEQTAYDLRKEEKLTGCITVKIRYANFENVTRQEVIDYTALDDVLMTKAKDIFTKLYKSGQKIRLLGVRFSQLIPFTLQTNLFDNSQEKLHLYQTIDHLKNKFGSSAITKATTLKKKGNK